MKQDRKTLFRIKAGLTLAFLCLCLALPPSPAAATGSVSPTQSSVTGQDFICLYGSYCTSVEICCTNPFPILNGDIVNKQQPWFLGTFNAENIVRFRAMTDQFLSGQTSHLRQIGGFFDAQNFSASTLSMQTLAAKAVRDYVPDDALCRFGTASRSLGNSEMFSRRVKLMLSEHAQNRQMLNKNSNAASTTERGREPGRAADKKGRLDQYTTTFCNSADNGFVMSAMCGTSTLNATTTTIPDRDMNRDIDYARSFETPSNLDLRYSGTGAPEADLRNILALGRNLYAHNIIQNRPNADMISPAAKSGNGAVSWADYRSVVAKHNVAQNSYNTIASMKMKGSNASNTYLRAMVKELGLAEADIDHLLGASQPSYYAQMEILTKKIYQNPGFYANLMQTPANIQRTQAALKAISLMQERDIADSLQRTEMLFSTLMELQLMNSQNKLMDTSTR